MLRSKERFSERFGSMSAPELYKGWLIEARPVFCVQVWSAAGECAIPVHNATTEQEALELAKRWIDLQSPPEDFDLPPNDPFSSDFDDDDIPF